MHCSGLEMNWYYWFMFLCCLCVLSGLFGRRTVRWSSLCLCLDCDWMSMELCTSLRPGQVTSAHTPAEWHQWAAMIPAARTYAWGQRWKPSPIILSALFPIHAVLHLFWSFLFDLFSLLHCESYLIPFFNIPVHHLHSFGFFFGLVASIFLI